MQKKTLNDFENGYHNGYTDGFSYYQERFKSLITNIPVKDIKIETIGTLYYTEEYKNGYKLGYHGVRKLTNLTIN